MAQASYIELLRDPRWQKKRLQIMERDGWECQMCHRKDITLTVHHRSYRTGAAPWEYEGYSLATLCEDCHKYERSMHAESTPTDLDTLRESLWADDLQSLAASLWAETAIRRPISYHDPLVLLLVWLVDNRHKLPEIQDALFPLMSARALAAIQRQVNTGRDTSFDHPATEGGGDE